MYETQRKGSVAMRVIFMGTPDFAVPTLEALISEGHEVVGVVTQADKPRGRGKAVLFPPVKEKALEHGLLVYQPAKVKDPAFLDLLKQLRPDVIVVVAFGKILPKAVLDLPRYGCINVHASLLPKYRGAAPIQWAVIDGEKESGVTTMYMDVGLDTGDMIDKTVVPLDERETGGSLHDKLAKAGAALLVETLKKLEDGTAVRIPQGEMTTEYAKMLQKSMGDIDWNKDAASIERLIRGLNPWPSAYSRLEGKTIKLWAADVLDEDYEGENGQIVGLNKDSILVKTGCGTLAVKELQLEGKKRMAADAFLRGYPLPQGAVLRRDSGCEQ